MSMLSQMLSEMQSELHDDMEPEPREFAQTELSSEAMAAVNADLQAIASYILNLKDD